MASVIRDVGAIFRLDNAVLAFRFTATVFDRAGVATERLTDPGRLELWLRANGLDFSDVAVTEADLATAKELRESIHRAGAAVADGGTIRSAAARTLNAFSRDGHALRLLENGEATWRGASITDALSVIAADAIETLGGPDRDRVKACSDEHCHGLYVDTSRANNRRWCNMNTCGNRAKKAAMSRLREER
ncbi:CGNR zinc finger domain-containing protein [Mycobacteroides salmoniphilum]|uniref:CGNR zinc finger domain-containing protein n=1 Tax=Mycobacteroides salmoniphilum TaxID=404941 RepID=UPI0010661CCC|nr:ABATE domain-containing protein [Mycobacteroides salmoniphilum]TDZ98103.1 CGNR zinc finger [Mycobacteroides salmoniphilum]